ncbi:MAG: hypothetical protein ACYCW6_11760 [Candidatus Xenobia bacterium]
MQIRPAPPNLGTTLEREVVAGFPNGAGNAEVPTPDELHEIRDLVEQARHGQDISSPAKTLGFDVQPMLDGNRQLLMLADRSRGWGTVVIDLHPEHDLVIEVPHPVFDWGTPQLGWSAFRKFHAAVLIVAGAERGNRSEPSPDVPPSTPHAPGVPDYSITDPSHSTDTAFFAAHQGATGPGTLVVQIHGFAVAKHPQFPATTQVVLTDAGTEQSPHLLAADAALQRAGYHAIMGDPHSSSGLAALPNVEHKDMLQRALPGAEFNHIEIDRSLRQGSPAPAESLLDALIPVYTGGATTAGN